MRERQLQRETSQGLTGELMLAKSVIEEKNEILDRKDEMIRQLASRARSLETDNEELRLALSRSMRRDEMLRAQERGEVLSTVVSDVVRVAADYEDVHGSSSTGLASRIFGLLQEKYDLRVITEPPQTVNPQLHHVVEVDHSGALSGSIEVLSNGYRLGETVIRPALVKVVLGVREGDRAAMVEKRFRITHGD
ncbi:MAG TPA: nucleotide exchange factor GrpE [Spirochaetia bacterium]|nr:nucleotide exchange factor GrpE [Spirochaetia bacterium]